MANNGVINLGLAVVVVGDGLQLIGSTLSVISGQSNVNAVIAPAGNNLTLAGGDGGASIVLSDGPTQTITASGAFQGVTVRVNGQIGNYTLSATDYYVVYTAAGSQTFNMIGQASDNTGRIIKVKNRTPGTGVLTISAAGLGQIWTNTGIDTVTCQPGECIEFISDGTYWTMTEKLSGTVV